MSQGLRGGGAPCVLYQRRQRTLLRSGAVLCLPLPQLQRQGEAGCHEAPQFWFELSAGLPPHRYTKACLCTFSLWRLRRFWPISPGEGGRTCAPPRPGGGAVALPAAMCTHPLQLHSLVPNLYQSHALQHWPEALLAHILGATVHKAFRLPFDCASFTCTVIVSQTRHFI